MLVDERYWRRHDQILKDIVELVITAIRTNMPNYDKSSLMFVKAGVKSKPKKKSILNAPSLAADWEFWADLGTRLKFPNSIAQTSLHSDIVIFSNKIKKIIMLELTVPWKELAVKAPGRKKYRYDELLETCKNNGWKASCLSIEVGWKGFCCMASMQDPVRPWFGRSKKKKSIETINGNG